MVNKSGNIGTAGETAVVRAIVARGFAYAERRRLHGALDKGDITGTPGVCWEVKAGNAAKTASDALVEAWMAETEVERINSRSSVGVLVVARRGIGAGNAHRWWAIFRSDALGLPAPVGEEFPVRLTLEAACGVLVDMGYGSFPIVEQEATGS